MKKLVLIVLAMASFLVTSARGQILVGSGPDSSYLVIEAGDFGLPFVFEYRYTYSPLDLLTTTDMLLAVDAASTDLSFELLYGGAFLNSVTYGSMTLTNSTAPPDYSPFWAQWVAGGESGDPLAPIPDNVWSAGYGPANRTLDPGSWDGFIFNGIYELDPPYDVISAPPSVAPVPEPTVALLLVVSGVGIMACRKRRGVNPAFASMR